ncbi:hypothetical protein DICVIV_00066 [Dictyocaulus viviparus]|uniref:Uncharacterized protein n=1 Tax=Dictyocaulus viviparus TaxID=29172 RepID=A0A0D8Y9W0_DICVI|nr:hypothetical protein DICVIV_00066 [Dictyocaulus viviparus]
MNDLIFLTYISTFVQILLLSVTIVLGIFTYRTLKTETVVEIGYVSKLLASTQASITHAEIPFPLLATIAHLYNINLNEFQKLWKHEKDTRCRKVLEVYKKDYLTINFIEKYAKFLRISKGVRRKV